MPRNLPVEPKLYRCLFCGETFHAKDVLFADEITMASQAYPDPVLVRHYETFVSAPDKIPTQLLHRWDGLPPQNLNFSSGEEIPDSIYVRCYDGQLKLDKPDAVQAQADAGAALLENLAGDGEQGNTAGQLQKIQKELLHGVDREHRKNIKKRICPHCHCAVPKDLGKLPIYRVSMLGGTSSGKTTYMLLAARQITKIDPVGNVLNDVLDLASGSLIGESALYFQQMYNLYLSGKLQGTPSTEYIAKPVFPLVFLVTPKNNSKAFFLILQDYPGEGMKRDDYFINSPSTLAADGVILMVAPEQMMNSAAVMSAKNVGKGTYPRPEPAQETFIGSPAESGVRTSPLELSLGPNISVARKHTEETDTEKLVTGDIKTTTLKPQYCIDDLPNTAKIISENITMFTRLQKIVVTLSKLDCLYKEDARSLSILQRGQYPLLENGDLRTDHQHCINRSVLNDLHLIMTQVFSTFERSTGKPERDYANLIDMLGCKGEGKPLVTLKAVSCYTWDDSIMEYVQFVSEQPVLGHRLLEPLLELLADAKLLPSWDPNAAEPRTPFGKRAGAKKQRN